MVCLLRNRAQMMKRTLWDIWGHTHFFRKITKPLKLIKYMRQQRRAWRRYIKREFVYSLRKPIFFKRKKKWPWNYLKPRLLKHYYIILKIKDFRRYMKYAVKKKGTFINNYIMQLEARLFMIVYRLNFINNLFIIKTLLKRGLFEIDGKVHCHSNVLLKKGQVFRPILQVRQLFWNEVYLKFKNNMILWSPPSYYHVNYAFMFFFIYKDPKLKDIKLPLKYIDVFVGSAYYHPHTP